MKMKHEKFNPNTSKKSNIENKRKNNIFMKSSGSYNFNTIKTSNLGKKKNYLISLLGKKNPKNLNLNKFVMNYKKNNKNEIYLTSGFENINNKKENKVRPLHRNINIRLNLNSEIINNNFGNYCFSTKNQNIHKSMSNFNLNERIKEKDKLITKLQSELLELQEFLSQLQNDKQNELYLTYKTMKDKDNSNTISYNNSLTAFLNAPSILKFNKSNLNIRNHAGKNKKAPLYFHSGFNTIKGGFRTRRNFIRSFSSTSSPRIFFPRELDNVDSYNNNFPIKSFKNKKDKNLRINYNSNPNIFFKKNYQFPSPKSYFTRHLSYSNYELDNNEINNSNSCFNNNYKFVDKCEKLKTRMKLILNKYTIIINELNNKYKEKKK